MVVNNSFVGKLITASSTVGPPQEISSMESELANLEAEIQMQQKNMEVKEVELKKIKDKMDRVATL